jgi:PhzF family phenazine biosynthesis protein
MPSVIQVDAFTAQPFAGNPAAVCILSQPQPDTWLQAVAQEMNLSETAFLVKQPDGSDGSDSYNLRWFTPTTEVDLCGHATLASAHVLWSEGHLAPEAEARFQTRSGLLTARQNGDWMELNFPAIPTIAAAIPADLSAALGGVSITETHEGSLGLLVELDSEATVRHLQPNFALLKSCHWHGVIVTSRADADADADTEFDFVSRYFAPNFGIDEDPVTGSAHCCLATYWHDRLHKSEFLAYQASARGGVMKVRIAGDRVFLGGQAVTVMRGDLLA